MMAERFYETYDEQKNRIMEQGTFAFFFLAFRGINMFVSRMFATYMGLTRRMIDVEKKKKIV